MSKALPIAIPASVALANSATLRSNYYHQANSLKVPADFSELVHHQRPHGFAPVLKPLLPEGVVLGSAIKEVCQKLGKPRYSLSNSHQIQSHEVVFYQKDMGPYLMYTQCHFFRSRLAYVEIRFLEKSKTKKVTQDILHKLVRRYAGADSVENAFQDTGGNRLWVEEGEVMVLHYLSGDPSLKGAFPAPTKFRPVRRQNGSKMHWLRDSA